MNTAMIPRATIERLINAAWTASALICTGSRSTDAPMREELREACNAARGALIADEVQRSYVLVPAGWAIIETSVESNAEAVESVAECLDYSRPEDLFNGA